MFVFLQTPCSTNKSTGLTAQGGFYTGEKANWINGSVHYPPYWETVLQREAISWREDPCVTRFVTATLPALASIAHNCLHGLRQVEEGCIFLFFVLSASLFPSYFLSLSQWLLSLPIPLPTKFQEDSFLKPTSLLDQVGEEGWSRGSDIHSCYT